MPNAKSLANLRPYKPGQSGNPKGRQRGKTIHELLHAELAKLGGPAGESNIEYLLHRLVQRALHSNNPRYAELVLAYAYGKPEQPIRLIEDQITRVALEEGLDPKVVLLRAREIAERLA